LDFLLYFFYLILTHFISFGLGFIIMLYMVLKVWWPGSMIDYYFVLFSFSILSFEVVFLWNNFVVFFLFLFLLNYPDIITYNMSLSGWSGLAHPLTSRLDVYRADSGWPDLIPFSLFFYSFDFFLIYKFFYILKNNF
jgi:hypothetical protein